MSSDVVIVYCTMPAGDVPTRIARTVVDEQLAACVNLLPGVASIYRWQGEVQQDDEVLAIIKTTASGFDALRSRLVELHPYDCPEVIATTVTAGHAPYLEWVAESVK
jgi:periplasmic divalent cation tolerance protein